MSVPTHTIVKRERGRYAVTMLLPDPPTRGIASGTWLAREVGEVRHSRSAGTLGGRLAWRHLLAPEREFRRMRACAEDLAYEAAERWGYPPR